LAPILAPILASILALNFGIDFGIDHWRACLKRLGMDSPISLLVEIPEALHYSLGSFLESRPDWDQDRVFSAAISLFLLQSRLPDTVTEEARFSNGDAVRAAADHRAEHRQTARIYLDTLFRKPTGAELMP
jgi:hypothetical protein